jgi:hypothetical protein
VDPLALDRHDDMHAYGRPDQRILFHLQLGVGLFHPIVRILMLVLRTRRVVFLVHHHGLLLALHLHLHLQLHLLLDLHLHGVRVLLFLRGLLADSPRTLGVPGRPRRVPVKGVVDLAVTVVALMTRMLVLGFELRRVRELALGERVVRFGLRLDDGSHPCARGVDCRV